MGILDAPGVTKLQSGKIARANARARGLVPIANKNRWQTSQTLGATGGITTMTRHTAVYGATGLALVYGNVVSATSSGDNDGPAAITINAGILLPSDTSKILRVSQGPSTDMVYQPGAIAATNVCGVDVEAGQYIFVRTWHNADGSIQYPFGYGQTTIAWGEGRTLGANNSNSGGVATSAVGGLAPMIILGYTDVQNPRAPVLFGDSIGFGVGDAAEVQRGFMQIACGNSIPLLNFTKSGEQLGQIVGRGQQYRMALAAAYATSAVVEYGTNDIYAGGVTASQLRALLMTFGASLKRLGIGPLYLTTLVPRVTSSDNYETASGQSPITSFMSINPEAERQTHNAWVRAGSLGPFDGYFDTAAAVEVDSANTLSLTGGRWKAGGILDNGTATAGTGNTLTDSSKSWTASAHVGYLVRIVSGTGSGQIRGIYANTATQLTVDIAWSTTPDATSVYRIYDGPTLDGIHPSSRAHASMATAIDITKL